MLTVPVMGESLGNAIRAARKAKNMTLVQVAGLLGVSYPAVQQWEKGKTDPSPENLLRLQEILGFDASVDERVSALLRTLPDATQRQVRSALVEQPADRDNRDDSFIPNADLSKAVELPNFRPFGGPRNVPEYGSTAGGKRGDADFRFNGQTVDYAPRLPGIANKKDVYTLRVVGDSMEPKFEEGERIYVDPHRQPAVMDYVVIELHPEDDTGEPGDSYIKRLVKKTPTKYVVLQYNPKREIEFDRDQVKNLHRVIPNDELFGV